MAEVAEAGAGAAGVAVAITNAMTQLPEWMTEAAAAEPLTPAAQATALALALREPALALRESALPAAASEPCPLDGALAWASLRLLQAPQQAPEQAPQRPPPRETPA